MGKNSNVEVIEINKPSTVEAIVTVKKLSEFLSKNWTKKK